MMMIIISLMRGTEEKQTASFSHIFVAVPQVPHDLEPYS